MNSLNTILSFIATKIGAFTNSISDLTGIVNGHTLSITSLQEDVSDIQAVIPSGVVEDYVEDMDVSGDWTYRKWHSGIAECWYKTEATVNAQYSNGGGYDTGTASTRYVVTPPNFPTDLFIEVPIVDCTIRGRERGFYSVPLVNPTSTSAGSWYGHRNASISGNERVITWQFYCIGKWK